MGQNIRIIEDNINNQIEPKEQAGEVHIFKCLTEKDNEIPTDSSLVDIYNRVRMLDHSVYQNAFIKHGDCKFKILNATLSDSDLSVTCRITKCSRN